MHRFVLGFVLSAAVLLPKVGNAQVYQRQTPPPQVTAASAAWQVSGQPIFYAGAPYYPTGPTVFFDGFVMVRTGVFEGVGLYADTTLEPFSMVFVPIGGNVMRPYERPRSGPLAGTVGSRTPSFPIQRDAELSATASTTGLVAPPSLGVDAAVPEADRSIGTTGSIAASSPSAAPASATNRSTRGKVVLQSIPGPRSNVGVWIEFQGERWKIAGEAMSYLPDQFAAIGEYHGFPVYRDAKGRSDAIYVPAVRDGALTPYSK